MTKAGEKQKKKPKIKDKNQSERFKQTAREIGADKPSEAFDRVIGEMGRRSSELPKDRE
jgi:hypothetical protein